MKPTDKVYVAGHRGMVGSAIVRKLRADGYENIVTRTSRELDLRNQQAVQDFFAAERPDYVFLAAAKVGGILANNIYRGEFLYDNLLIEANVIEAARVNEVRKLQFLGSSCIYPKLAPQPLTEDALLTGPLEETNEPYAIAKITGIKLCDAYRSQYGCDFISVMPTNLYGPNDNYDLQSSHVLPALIRKFHEAKTGRNGGSGHVGNRLAEAGVPPRRRPGRRLRLPDASTSATTGSSTSVPVRTSASCRSPKPLRTWSATKVPSPRIPPSPTVPPANS